MTTFEKICDWEEEAGESFTDYFMHDNIYDGSWAFWLLGKGFSEKGNWIIDQMVTEDYKKWRLDQEELYEIYPEYLDENTHSEENADKNRTIWAEFIDASNHYTNKFNEWLKNN